MLPQRLPAEDVHNAASGLKERVIVPGADHVDPYDDLKKIPFDRLDTFFKQRLA